jgi:porin
MTMTFFVSNNLCRRRLLCALAPGLLLVAAAVSPAKAQVPTPNYSGDFLTRSTFTGDWGGVRNDLAKKGVTFDIYMTQIWQGVVSGGKTQSGAYGGRGDMTMTVDTGKLGLWNGGFLTVEVEGNWGKGVNANTGSLMPVNTSQLFPVPGKTEIGVPAFNYVQFLSPNFGVVVGKLDAFGADQNEFAHGKYGKGDTAFMNTALNVNPLTLFTSPYSPLVAGATILPTGNPKDVTISLLVLTTTGSANTAGFNNVRSDDLSFFGEARVRTDFFGMTGHQLIGGLVSTKEYTSITQQLSLEPGATLATKKGSWVVYYNFDQYFYEPVKGSGKGAGVFGRFGVSDGNPNFLQYFYSFGVGGKGVFTGRPDDQFGVGFYYINISNPTLDTPFGNFQLLRDERGIEVFYSIALTPWAHLTPNIQFIRGAQKQTLALSPADRRDIQTSTTIGLRLGLAL